MIDPSEIEGKYEELVAAMLALEEKARLREAIPSRPGVKLIYGQSIAITSRLIELLSSRKKCEFCYA